MSSTMTPLRPPTSAPSPPSIFRGEPFLTREAGGYRIDLHWDEPKTAHVSVIVPGGKVTLHEFDVPVALALEAFHHTARHSEPYTEALT